MVQDALYENDNDARSAARAIDLYKADMGIGKKKPKSDKDAAKSVATKDSRSKPQENEESTYLKESEVQRMSPKEYEKRSDEIMEAIRSGKFIYDVSVLHDECNIQAPKDSIYLLLLVQRWDTTVCQRTPS